MTVNFLSIFFPHLGHSILLLQDFYFVPGLDAESATVQLSARRMLFEDLNGGFASIAMFHFHQLLNRKDVRRHFRPLSCHQRKTLSLSRFDRLLSLLVTFLTFSTFRRFLALLFRFCFDIIPLLYSVLTECPRN